MGPRTVRKKSSTSSYNSLPRQERSSSQPRARTNSFRLPSPAPSPDSYSSKPNWKNSLRSSESPSRSYRGTSAPRKTSRRPSQPQRDSESPNRERYTSKSPERSTRQSESPEQVMNNGRRSLSSDGMSARSSNSSTDWGYTSYSSSSSKYSSSMRNTSYEEADEQDYDYARAGKNISLGALKTPEISPWDSMGILGLSSKMYADTSTNKEGIFSSSSLMRRESVTTHAM